MRTYALFLKILLPAGGASATFFPAALTPSLTFFFWAADAVVFWDRPPFFTTVVAFEVVDVLLWLLTVRISGMGGGSIPRFERVDAGFVGAAAFVVGFRPAVAFPRATLGLLVAGSAMWFVAATAANLAGEPGVTNENCFEGLAGFNGDTGRERWSFWGEPKTGRTGDWSVREFRDLGESTLEGFVTWREGALVAFFGRFLGFGILCAGSGVFSLSAFSKCSLQWV